MSHDNQNLVQHGATRALMWGQDPEEGQSPEFERSLAVVIGINNYQQVKPLQTAANDAKHLAEILEKQHQYQVILLTEDVTLARLKTLLATELPGRNLNKKDRVLFYFAGHGVALDGRTGPEGYLIPQDADPVNSATFLSMTDLQQALAALNCRHMLVVLDCCFAGAFKWGATRDVPLLPPQIYRRQYQRFTRDPAWQVITSAAHDQKALDIISGQVIGARDNAGGHSPFAEALFKALQGDGDIVPPDGDGLITATELYFYLRYQVEPATEEQATRQTPGIWFLPKHDKGEFVFSAPNWKPDKLAEAPILDEENSPYRGLNSFEKDDHLLFFGRDEVIKELATVVSAQLLTVVLGVSGTGKSSLVKAGLIPYLENAQILEQHGPSHSHQATPATPDGPTWHILPPIRPTKHPLRQLELVLQDHLALAGMKTITDEWAKDSQALTRLATAWTEANPDRRLLLVIDQFEELVTVCESVIERDKFLALLINLVQANPARVHLALTLRSDFEPRFTQTMVNPQSAGSVIGPEIWSKARFLVRAMTPSELRQAIEGPALAKVLYFDSPRLVDDLIDEVSQTPSPLPLLSFTLNEMYLRYVKRQADGLAGDRTLTRADYEALGGVVGSLQQRANKEYEQLKQNPAAQETMRRVMLRMLAVEGGEIARRRVPESELDYNDADENERVAMVLKNLERARLVVSGEMEDEPYVEPAHDTLIQAWEQLAKWRVEEGDRLLLQRRVTQAAVEWQRIGKTEGLWDDDPRLPQVEQILERQTQKLPTELPKPALATAAKTGRPRSNENWFIRNIEQVIKAFKNEAVQLDDQYWLNRLELEFVRASVAQRYQDLRRLVLTVAGVIGVLAALTIFAFIQQQSAIREGYARATAEATAVQAAGTAVSEANLRATEIVSRTTAEAVAVSEVISRSTAEALAVERQRAAEIAQAKQATADAQTLVEVNARVTAQAGEAIATATAGAEAFARATAQANEIQARETAVFEREQKVLNIQIKLAQSLAKAAEDTNGRGDDELTTLLAIQAFRENPKASEEAISQIDQVLRTVLTKPDFSTLLRGHSSSVKSLAFSPDGTLLASASDDRTIRVWHRNDPAIAPIVLGQEIFVTNPATAPTDNRPAGIAFSPDGNLLVSGHTDCAIRVWDMNNPDSPPRELNGKHEAWITSVAFHPDGHTIASAGADGVIRLWDVSSGNQINQFVKDESPFTSEDVTPSGPFGQPRIYTTAKLDPDCPPISLSPFVNPLTAIAFNSTGDKLAAGYEILGSGVGDSEGILRIWDIDTDTMDEYRVDSGAINSLGFNPIDDNTLISVGANGDTLKWNPSDLSQGPELLDSYESETKSLLSIAFSLDGKTLATGGNDGIINLWDVETKQPIRQLQVDSSEVFAVAFSPDGTTLASSSGSDTRLWDLTPPQAASKVIGQDRASKEVRTLVVNTKNSLLAAGTESGTIFLWEDLSNLTDQPDQWEGHFLGVNSLAFSPDGQTLASGGSDGAVYLWDVNNPGKKINDGLQQHEYESLEVSSVAFNPDGTILASAGNGLEEIKLWDLKTGQVTVIPGYAKPEGAIVPSKSLTFSPDGTVLLSSSYDKSIGLWDLSISPIALARKLNTIEYGGYIKSLAFSPDGKTFAGAGFGQVVLWNWENLDESPRLLQGHEVDNSVNAVVFSPDGKLLASAGNDGTIRVWNALDGTQLRVLTGHKDRVKSVAFLDNETLVSGGDYGDGTIRLWGQLSTEELVELGCQRVRRNLTQLEWERYLYTEEYEKTCEKPPSGQIK